MWSYWVSLVDRQGGGSWLDNKWWIVKMADFFTLLTWYKPGSLKHRLWGPFCRGHEGRVLTESTGETRIVKHADFFFSSTEEVDTCSLVRQKWMWFNNWLFYRAVEPALTWIPLILSTVSQSAEPTLVEEAIGALPKPYTSQRSFSVVIPSGLWSLSGVNLFKKLYCLNM